MSVLNNFNYQILGDSSSTNKLVFLHGLMGFASNWKRVARQFEDDFQILMYDQRGHGRSFQPEMGYGTKHYGADLAQILDELGWEKINLVGHSMGGRVAVEFASSYPEKVEKLIIVDIGPESDQASMEAILQKIKAVPVPFASRDEARAYFDGPFMEKFNNEMVKQFFYANLYQTDNGEMQWRFSLPGVIQTLEEARKSNQWSQFQVMKEGTLLLRGEKSDDLPRDLYARTLEKNNSIQGVVIPGAGHWLHVEKPSETIEILEAFLRDSK